MRYVNPDRKMPKSIDGYADAMIARMRLIGEIARRYLAEGKEVPHNPTGLPECSVAYFTKGRERAAARRLVAKGIAVIAHGSLQDGCDAYLIAGPQFPA